MAAYEDNTCSEATAAAAAAECSTGDCEGESTVKVGFNVLNTIIGSGVVCLPYALHNAGFFFGILMLAVVAGLSQFALYALIVTGKRTGTSHFSALTQAALGRTGYHLLNYSMVIDMVGTVILYLMLIADLATFLVDYYSPFAFGRGAVLTFVSTAFILPQLFYRNTGPLARLSIISILCLPYIILAVALRAPLYSGQADAELTTFGPRILPAMGVLAFTYSSCHAAFPNYLGLRNRSVKAWVSASSSATIGAAAISTAFAITGYLSFGSASQANILDNFPPSDSYINIGRLLFALTLILTTPMGFYPIRDTVTEMLQIDPERHGVSKVYESTCTAAIFAGCVLAAVICRDLGLAYELIGALSSSVVNFLLPALVYLWAGTDVTLGAILANWRSDDQESHQPLLPLSDRSKLTECQFGWLDIMCWALAWTVAIFGVWVMVLGTLNISRSV
ncbi:hypothetical protein GGI12_004893 [Dipsacomyces acuminosporus]|nr:hypothetical protein GGI12_004893 [Dipsacomyces acuminosporus]